MMAGVGDPLLGWAERDTNGNGRREACIWPSFCTGEQCVAQYFLSLFPLLFPLPVLRFQRLGLTATDFVPKKR